MAAFPPELAAGYHNSMVNDLIYLLQVTGKSTAYFMADE